jgi:hypothetical protein
MYNELFKMLAERGAEHLQRYWLEIAGLQRSLLGPYVERAGFRGMYEYWDHIRIEENCEMDLEYGEDYFHMQMLECPSLSKNLDNDAGLCPVYCDHCAGWIVPVLESYGYHVVYDMISRTEPRCEMWVFADADAAAVKARQATLPAEPYPEGRGALEEQHGEHYGA